MNERLVESVAQTILAMSAEERQLLEQSLHSTHDDGTAELEETANATDEHNAVSNKPLETEQAVSDAFEQNEKSSHQESLRSFFAHIRSFQIDGPEDWSSRVDDYLHEDLMSQHE